MAQGDQLPSIYSYSEGLAIYVDGGAGNDTTGDGSSGAPFATLQKAHDHLRDTATWPGSGDVIVYIRKGVYKAASSSQATLQISWTNGARRATSTKRVVWKPWPGSEGKQVIVRSPDGTGAGKMIIYCQGASGSFTADYQIFEDLDLDGERVVKGNNANGSHIGVYLNGTSGNTVGNEIRGCLIHGIYGSGSNVSVNGILAESGADLLVVRDTVIYDVGTRVGTILNQSHGFYIQNTDAWFDNCLVHTIPNGYSMQFFSGDGGAGALITHCTLVGGFASGIVVADTVSNFEVRNSIIANHRGRGSSSFGIEFLGGTPGTGNVVDNVLYWNNFQGNRSSTPASGWTFTNERSGTRVHPLFLGADDYRLDPDSPARLLVANGYSSSADLDGVTRTDGGEFAGCYHGRLLLPRTARKNPLPIGAR